MQLSAGDWGVLHRGRAPGGGSPQVSSPSPNINIPLIVILRRTTIALMGKLFAAGNFSVVYMYTAEIYPTVIR